MKARTALILKAVVWRAISTALTYAVAKGMGLPAERANLFTLAYAVCSTALYLAYESAWSRIESKTQK